MVGSSKIYIFNMAAGSHLELAIFRMFVPDSKFSTVPMLFLGVKLV